VAISQFAIKRMDPNATQLARGTSVFVKQDGCWQLVAFQASPLEDRVSATPETWGFSNGYVARPTVPEVYKEVYDAMARRGTFFIMHMHHHGEGVWPLTADEFERISPTGAVETLAQMLQAVAGNPTQSPLVPDEVEMFLRVYGDTAVITSRLRWNSGQPPCRSTEVWVKDDTATWRVFSLHVTAIVGQ
jgi:hypothetical protein